MEKIAIFQTLVIFSGKGTTPSKILLETFFAQNEPMNTIQFLFFQKKFFNNLFQNLLITFKASTLRPSTLEIRIEGEKIH